MANKHDEKTTDELLEEASKACKEALEALEDLLPKVSKAAMLYALAGCSDDTLTLSRTFQDIAELTTKVAPELRPLS